MNIRGDGTENLRIQSLPLEQSLALVREKEQETQKALAKSKAALVPAGGPYVQKIPKGKGSLKKRLSQAPPRKQRRNKNRIDLYFGQGRNKSGVHFVQGGLAGGSKH
jgi:hypothetical protein